MPKELPSWRPSRFRQSLGLLTPWADAWLVSLHLTFMYVYCSPLLAFLLVFLLPPLLHGKLSQLRLLFSLFF
jgi:hypothetical protein